MTVATKLEGVAEVVGRELRRQVHRQLRQEHDRLWDIERLALLLKLDGAEEATATEIRRAIAKLDYRIAALRNCLATEHQPHDDEVVCPGCCVLLDRGTKPHWFLLAALPEQDLPVIASDSALGRALIGARPDRGVEYPHPTGVRTARVLALG